MSDELERFWQQLYALEHHRQSIKDLDYMGDGPLAPATSKQRGYIYGLVNKIGSDLRDYGVEDAHELTIVEAHDLIEELKVEADTVHHERYSNKGFNNLF